MLDISATFRSSKLNECYVFVKEKYVVVNYAPGEKKKKIINGPMNIVDGFPILAKTVFETGIDCAFDIEDSHAFIFRGNQCAKIDYSPHDSTKTKLLLGPIPITGMFPSLKGTEFENGIECAVRYVDKSAYLFKGEIFAHINYHSKSLIINSYTSVRFQCFNGTVFEINGFDAAFTSHIENEYYFFKGRNYVRIRYGPNEGLGRMVNGRIERISSQWPALKGILK